VQSSFSNSKYANIMFITSAYKDYSLSVFVSLYACLLRNFSQNYTQILKHPIIYGRKITSGEMALLV